MSPFASLVLEKTSQHTKQFELNPIKVATTVSSMAAPQDTSGPHSTQSVTSGHGPGIYASASSVSRSIAGNDRNTNNQVGLAEVGLRRRQQLEDEDPYNRWVVVCFPKTRGKSMEHIDAFSAREDVELFREIRDRYEKLRPKWRRILELRDLYKIRIAKVRPLVAK